MWVNLVSFLIQALLVSRIIQKLGVRAALFVMPIVAFGAYGIIGAGSFALVRTAKVAENSTDYSLQNTVRQALFLPTDRAVKYKAKAAIDTFFVRTGDTLQALLVYVGVSAGLAVSGFAAMNVGFTLVWLVIAVLIFREHKKLSAQG